MSRFRVKKLHFDIQMRRADGGWCAAGVAPHDADPTDSMRGGIWRGDGVGIGVDLGWIWGGQDGDGICEDVEKCKKNVKKCKNYCV